MRYRRVSWMLDARFNTIQKMRLDEIHIVYQRQLKGKSECRSRRVLLVLSSRTSLKTSQSTASFNFILVSSFGRKLMLQTISIFNPINSIIHITNYIAIFNLFFITFSFCSLFYREIFYRYVCVCICIVCEKINSQNIIQEIILFKNLKVIVKNLRII